MIRTKIKDKTGLILIYKNNTTEAFTYIKEKHNFIDSEGEPLSIIPILSEEDLGMCLNDLEMVKSCNLIKDYEGDVE